MLSRRRLVLSSASFAFASRCTCSMADSLSFTPPAGCSLTIGEANSLESTQRGRFRNRDLRGKSGDAEFDYALAQTLAKLADSMKVLPGFSFYDDEGSPNAMASPSTILGRPDGSVVMG